MQQGANDFQKFQNFLIFDLDKFHFQATIDWFLRGFGF